jgi:hypothetical protein
MDSIYDRQRIVEEFVNGDATHLQTIYNYYHYIAEKSSRYIFSKMYIPPTITYEELEQQASYELLNILTRRVCGKTEKEGLYKIHDLYQNEYYLGLRPFLIASVRLMLRIFVIEQSRIIKISKIIYEKEYIKCHGEPSPVKVISNVSYDNAGQEYQHPGSIPVDVNQPSDYAIANELIYRADLTSFERKIVEMKQEGWTLEDIGDVLGKNKSTISRKLQTIQMKWKRFNGA